MAADMEVVALAIVVAASMTLVLLAMYLRTRAWEVGKALPVTPRLAVRSIPEQRIAAWLSEHGVPFEYEARVCGFRPDFFLRRPRIVIEYWGSRDARYLARRRMKTAVYLQNGFRLVSLEAGKEVSLEEDLRRQLWHKGVRPARRHPGSGPSPRT